MKFSTISFLLLTTVTATATAKTRTTSSRRNKKNEKGNMNNNSADFERRVLKSGGGGDCLEFPGGGKGNYRVATETYCEYTEQFDTLEKVELGDWISCDVKLKEDIDCTRLTRQGQPCLVIDADAAGHDIIFDCDDHKILGPGITNPAILENAEKGILVLSSQYDVTIKNCFIEDFDDCIKVNPKYDEDYKCVSPGGTAGRNGGAEGTVLIESTKVEGCDNGIWGYVTLEASSIFFRVNTLTFHCLSHCMLFFFHFTQIA